jgi:competence protein ComEC
MLFSAVASVAGLAAGQWPLAGIADAATWLAGGAAWLALRAIITLGSAVASVPHASVDISVPGPLAVAWLPVVALATWALRTDDRAPDADAAAPGQPGRVGSAARRCLRPVPLGAALVALLAAISLGSLPDGRLHLTVLDIGQGDAILVEAPSGATALIDGGPDPELTLRRLGANLPFFQRRVDLVVVSHPHQDHVAGLVDVVERFRVGTVLHAGISFANQAYERLLTDATGDPGIRLAVARAGQAVRLDGATTLEVLYPDDADATAPLPEGDINNGSIVMLLRHGGFEALLTGDAERPVEETLLARRLLTPVDVLKVGHHGSESSTTASLLEATRPSVAVISAGADNEYGHPAPPTLDALAAVAGLTILRTDLYGDVEIVSDGSRYRVHADAGWSEWRATLASADGATIEPCPCPTDPRRGGSSPRRSCQTASSSTPRASPAWPSPPRASSPRHGSRSTVRSWRRRHCSTTSTSSRFGGRAASTASWAPAGSRPRGTPNSRCRSPPTR